ncbi:MAG: hypothetical protein IJ724_04915 [Muribaculaceae bacterium]|nr:hypothetical protein [Muribaculaceae bacterium]MBR1474863.1 hypothetical protein [Muribaculaceae bacterium]MBR1725980.1 hypothetical protein [Muribaculaceae bacterium]
MKTNGQNQASAQPGDYEQLRRLIEQQVRHIARRGFTPKPDNATRQGWYKRLRRLLTGVC